MNEKKAKFQCWF